MNFREWLKEAEQIPYEPLKFRARNQTSNWHSSMGRGGHWIDDRPVPPVKDEIKKKLALPIPNHGKTV